MNFPFLHIYSDSVPFKTYEDLDGPVIDVREAQPVYLTEFDVKKIISDQKDRDASKQLSELEIEISQLKHDSQSELNNEEEKEEDIDHPDDKTIKNLSPLPPRTYFPKPTFSPTKDPFYLRTQKDKIIRKKSSLGGISNEYIYKKQFLRPKMARFENSGGGEHDFSYQRADPLTIDASRYVLIFFPTAKTIFFSKKITKLSF